jgi:hypothetical protein
MSVRTVMSVEIRQGLVEDSRLTPCYLDGHPAVVSGYRNPHATVQRKDGRGGRVDFAWATVARILERHRRFES